MVAHTTPHYLYFKGIRLEEWWMDAGSDTGTLFGLIRHPATGRGNALCRCAFRAGFSHISSFFALGGDPEDPVLERMYNLLCAAPEEDFPLFFSFRNPQGKAMYLPGAVLKAYRAAPTSDAYRTLTGEAFYTLDNILSISEYRKQQQRQQQRKGINRTLEWLGRRYEKYLRLRHNGATEADARQKLGLGDDILFRLAAQQHGLGEKFFRGGKERRGFL